MIPSRREVLFKVLRKLASPGKLRSILEFKLRSGDEYAYFDFADFFPWLAAPLTGWGRTQLDIDSPVFIAGLRRSGTTVFYRIMNANSRLFLFNERFPGDRLNGRGVASLRNLYCSIDDPREFRRIAVRYLSPRLRARHERWGAKLALELAHPDPGSISLQAMERILKAFPRARVIGITRDPRDFVLSALKRGGHDVAWWTGEYTAMMQLFRKLQVSHGNAFLSIRYEDLVDQAEQIVRHCCEFARIPFEQEMLNPSHWSVKGPKEYESRGIVARHGKWRDAKGADLETVKCATEACFPAACHFGYVPE
jgi:hypothetical protein